MIKQADQTQPAINSFERFFSLYYKYLMNISSHVAAARAGRRPTPRTTVSEWADANRMLSTVSAKEPGRWKTSRTPYLREVMDCLSESSPHQVVVAMMASQVGKTEAGLNWIGSIIHLTPGPILMVQPTLGTAKTYSKQRLAPMVDASPVLRGLVLDPRSRDSGNTMLLKEFRGGLLCIVGSNSSAALSSMPIRFLFCDEVDRFEGDIDDQGDPVGLAMRRTNTYGNNKKVFLTSTPTIKGFSRIEKAFLESDQRYYWVPCPHCNEKQILEWAQILWPDGQPELACYSCIHCKKEIAEFHKTWMLQNGEWVASAPGPNKPAGFHLNGLYCPLGWNSWGSIAIEFLKKKGDPFQLKEWTNTVLAQTWEEQSEKLDGAGLIQRRENFGLNLPEGIVCITAGVDVQDDRLEMEIVGWGRNEESWSLDHIKIYGDPTSPPVWQDLDLLIQRQFPHSRELPDLRIRAVAIDSGHHTSIVYAFCKARNKLRVWPVKGFAGPGRLIWPKAGRSNNKERVTMFSIGVDTAKDAIYKRLSITNPGPGYCHFPQDRDAEWFVQLTSEKVRTRYVKGRKIREWYKKDGDRNEALDCRVYAMAALYGLMSMGLQLDREADQREQYPLKNTKGMDAGVVVPRERVAPVPATAPAEPQQPDNKPSWLGSMRARWAERQR
ncbi:MAG: phage terminase large subunit family protein [Magnetococcales bacterium]|nr:phage terminase large subunit family protein [Magnetococcales bacterium]